MFVDLQLARLQCDAAELTDSLTSDSVVCGCTMFGAEAAGGMTMTRGYGEIGRLWRSEMRDPIQCWHLGQGWGRPMSGHCCFAASSLSAGKNKQVHGLCWMLMLDAEVSGGGGARAEKDE